MSTQGRAIAGPHLVRYGMAADQKFLVDEFVGTFDELIVNASLVAYMPAAIASFLSQKVRNKPFFIDPQTHAFQHDPSYLASRSEKSGGRIKKSMRLLAEAYGAPVQTHVDRSEAVLSEDFSESPETAQFCERVLRFQFDRIAEEVQGSDSAKYFEFLHREEAADPAIEVSPSLLIAPYFYMTTSTLDEWLDVNVRCAELSIEVSRTMNRPLGAEVVLSRDLLTDRMLRTRIVDAYRTLGGGIAAFLVWIDGLSEQRGSQTELQALIDFFNELGEQSPVVNLYGGYFSVALRHCGIVGNLVGVAHSLEYGEDRNVVPVGGGIHIPRFYMPSLHSRLAFRQAVRAVQAAGGFGTLESFRSRVCSCRECRANITSDPSAQFVLYGESKPVAFPRSGQLVVMEFPTTDTKNRCVKHYMWCRDREYKTRVKTDTLVAQLNEARDLFRRPLGLEASHCGTWARVLSDNA